MNKKPFSLQLREENFLNADGIINRIISINYPDNTSKEFTAHTAHYSDNLVFKKIETQVNSYLIAEDKTGYTVWDLKKKKIAAQHYGLDVNKTVDSLSNNASDFMTRTALSNKEWAKILKLKKLTKTQITNLE